MSPAGSAELVLEHLLEAGGGGAPPDEVAHKLGLSAGEMYAAIEALRESGYQITHVDRPTQHGLLLVRGPDHPLAADFMASLQTRVLGRNLVYCEELESTSSLAQRLAETGAEHGSVVLAGRQTAGRGRRGRTWLSLPGQQLYLSVILRPALGAERIFELTLVSVVALAEALEACGLAPEIKWPNDIEAGGRKLAGILCESALDGQASLKHVIVGVGTNVDAAAEEIPDELRGRATSVRAVTGRAGLTAFLAAMFLERLEEWLVLHDSLGFGAVLDTWRARTTTLDAEVRALVDGQVITGVAEDVDEAGALLVRDENGRVHRIIAGEVTTMRRLDRPARE
jgi:BirA family biotin operon repressor/biotin-[acetyl-CoA-carboxylase] ligase